MSRARTSGASKASRPEGPFRIHTVAELTGVPEPTLRAWERRYGIPSPERTDSGYRLYGESEIAQVERMRQLCQSGMAASDAARSVVRERGAETPPSASLESGHVESQKAILRAVERFDDAALELEMRKLYFMGSPADVLDHAVAPVLRAVGEKWHEGKLSVAQEHLASQRIGTFLRDLARLSAPPSPRARVVVASFADDDHELGLYGLAIRLSSWGLGVVNLGARTPPQALENAVDMLEPALVGLSLTLTPPAARARELCRDYARACKHVPFVVGGLGARAISDLIESHGGSVAPDDHDELRALLQRIIGQKRISSRKRKAKA